MFRRVSSPRNRPLTLNAGALQDHYGVLVDDYEDEDLDEDATVILVRWPGST